MTPSEAAQRLVAFEREHGRTLVDFASHAALPVVLNAEAAHLIRINYFIDPPQTLAYAAEASLLLSSLCTEIDDGLYVMDPVMRDQLLTRLVEHKAFGGKRLRDVARLLWEYGARGTPWGDSPGLSEAQQLTALNFIDAPRARSWLQRARRGEGALPVNDDRWFVALEQDLVARAATVEHAEGSAATLAGKLPALIILRDALDTLYTGRGPVLRAAAALNLTLSDLREDRPTAHLWQDVLDAAWVAGRMPELLQTVAAGIGDNPRWAKALTDYWLRVSIALPVHDGRFDDPPPEWQQLEQVRPSIERALRALALIVVEEDNKPRTIAGMGPLVGDYAVLSHGSMIDKTIVADDRMKPGVRVFAEFADEYPTFPSSIADRPPSARRLFLDRVIVDKESGLAILGSAPDADVTGLPQPLEVRANPPENLVGTKVCVLGYPVNDQRNLQAVASRVFGDTYGILRVQPGEVIDYDHTKHLIVHNCFTAGGNGGSPLLDLQSGKVLGLHYAAFFEPTTRGFKRGNAIPLYEHHNDPRLQMARVFQRPRTARAADFAADPREVFINRVGEQDVFRRRLDEGGGQLLLIDGPRGVGKTALLRRFADITRSRGIEVVFMPGGPDYAPIGTPEFLARLVGLLDIARAALDRGSTSSIPLKQALEIGFGDRRVVLIIDDVGRESGGGVGALFAELMPHFVVTVVAGDGVMDVTSGVGSSPLISRLYLGPLDPVDIEQFLIDRGFDRNTAGLVLKALGKDLSMSAIMRAIAFVQEVPPERVQQTRPTPDAIDVRLPTTTIVNVRSDSIRVRDDILERHGPYVVTRGRHALTPPTRYGIGVMLVTNQQFLEFVRDRGYQRDELWSGVPPELRPTFTTHDGSPGPANWPSATSPDLTPNHPVSGVCYYEALAYIAWLERTAPGAELRWCLPTEDMWEYAARGTDGRLYPWGSKFEPRRCNSREEGTGTTTAVGYYPLGQSPAGVHDMAGNVWEFVRADDQDLARCALRGGSYTNTQDEVKSSLRLIKVPREHRAPDFGFRCALELRHPATDISV